MLFVSVSKRMLARKRGINVSTFKILLVLFNKMINYFKRIENWVFSYHHLINMHLSRNWLLQHAYLYLNPAGWELGACCRQAVIVLTNHYDYVFWYVMVQSMINDHGLDGRFNGISHPLVQFQWIHVIPHYEILGIRLKSCFIVCAWRMRMPNYVIRLRFNLWLYIWYSFGWIWNNWSLHH